MLFLAIFQRLLLKTVNTVDLNGSGESLDAVKSACLHHWPSGERSLLSRQPSLWRHDSRPFNVRARGVMKTRGVRDDVPFHGPGYLKWELLCCFV